MAARQAARKLLTLDAKDPRRMFEGDALLRRMVRYGMLGEEEKKLDYVLQLTTSKMLERRLQTIVFKGQVNGVVGCALFDYFMFLFCWRLLCGGRSWRTETLCITLVLPCCAAPMPRIAAGVRCRA